MPESCISEVCCNSAASASSVKAASSPADSAMRRMVPARWSGVVKDKHPGVGWCPSIFQHVCCATAALALPAMLQTQLLAAQRLQVEQVWRAGAQMLAGAGIARQVEASESPYPLVIATQGPSAPCTVCNSVRGKGLKVHQPTSHTTTWEDATQTQAAPREMLMSVL